MIRPSIANRSGAALLLALWALFLLSAMVIAWALDIDSRITLSGNSSRVLEAEAMASSGAEVALDPAVKPRSSVLRGSLGRNQTYEARMTGEGGRLNLNVIARSDNPRQVDLLRKYLEVNGIDLNERDRMIDTLLDYVDPDDLPRLNGAETEQDYQPRNALLQSVDELKKVKSWEKFTTDPNWEADFTIYTTDGKIDLAWASRDVLLALPGFNEPIVDRFLELRRGPDGIEGTEDDPVFDATQVQLALGFTPDQFAQIQDLIVVNPLNPVMRVVSVGKSGGATRTVQMIIRKSATPQIIRWKEL